MEPTLARKIHVYKDVAQIAIDRGLETSEKIHITIQDFILDTITLNTQNQPMITQLKSAQRENIKRIYRFSRDINRQVGHAMSDFLGVVENKSNMKYLFEKF